MHMQYIESNYGSRVYGKKGTGEIVRRDPTRGCHSVWYVKVYIGSWIINSPAMHACTGGAQPPLRGSPPTFQASSVQVGLYFSNHSSFDELC